MIDKNWESLVEEHDDLIDWVFEDDDGVEWEFFGLVHASDDYYYGFWNVKDRKLFLYSCVGKFPYTKKIRKLDPIGRP